MADFRNYFRRWSVLVAVLLMAPILSGSGYYNSRLSSGNLNLFSGLVAAYSFSEGSGSTTADLSGNGYTLTKYLGSPSWTTSGHTGDALLTTTTNDGYDITTNALALTTAFTMMGWVYPTQDPGSGESLLESFTVPGPDWPYGVEIFDYSDAGGNPTCYYKQSSSTYPFVAGSSKLSINKWTHVACTFDGTSLNLYVNGVVQDTSNSPGTIDEAIGGRYVVGADNATDQTFKGRFDDVRLYDRALSAAEIVQAMNMPVAP
jgi:hypothetical protein